MKEKGCVVDTTRGGKFPKVTMTLIKKYSTVWKDKSMTLKQAVEFGQSQGSDIHSAISSALDDLGGHWSNDKELIEKVEWYLANQI